MQWKNESVCWDIFSIFWDVFYLFFLGKYGVDGLLFLNGRHETWKEKSFCIMEDKVVSWWHFFMETTINCWFGNGYKRREQWRDEAWN